MRIVYIGALTGGRKNLEALAGAGFRPLAVFTLDESHAGASCYEPFDSTAGRLGLRLFKVRNINDGENVDRIRDLKPDLIVVMSFSQLIGSEILSVPAIGTIGMHPTLLPKNRGRAPIPWALIKGLDKTGVSIFFYEEKVDAGPIVCQEEIPIAFEDTAMTLGQKVDDACIRQMLKAVSSLADGTARPAAQDDAQANYWPKRNPGDGIIDWSKSTIDQYNWIRGLTHPYPGAFTYADGMKVFVWEARPCELSNVATPGAVTEVDEWGMHVATADGCLALKRLQADGCPEQDWQAFAEEHGIVRGTKFRDK